MSNENNLVPYSPQVIALAEENGIKEKELETIKGTGSNGTILVGDVRKYVKEKKAKGGETKSKAVTYIAKYTNLKLVMTPSFHKEVNGQLLLIKGKKICFEQSVYTTSDPEEISFLENHGNYNQIFRKAGADVAKDRAEYNKTLEQVNAEQNAEIEELKAKVAKMNREEVPTKVKKGKGKPKF